jgi:hypothetical protein
MLRPIKETDLNLLQLAGILDDSKFEYDQERFFHSSNFGHAPSCALGHWWAAHGGNRDGIRWHEFYGFSMENRMSGPYVEACLLPTLHKDFEITQDEVIELFGGNGCGNANNAAQASAYIRAFVERRIAERETARQLELTL